MCQVRGKRRRFVRMRTEESHFRGNSETRRDTVVCMFVCLFVVVVVVVVAAAAAAVAVAAAAAVAVVV